MARSPWSILSCSLWDGLCLANYLPGTGAPSGMVSPVGSGTVPTSGNSGGGSGGICSVTSCVVVVGARATRGLTKGGTPSGTVLHPIVLRNLVT